MILNQTREDWYSTGVLNGDWPDLGRESIPLRKGGARGLMRKSGRQSRAISSISDIKVEFDISSHANGDAESVPRAVASVAPPVAYSKSHARYRSRY